MSANLFIFCYILFAVFWGVPQENLIYREIRRRLAFLIRCTGLGYAWDMYRGPFRQVSRVEIRVRYTDGTTGVPSLPRRYEFRRYGFMMAVHGNPSLWSNYLRFAEKRLFKLSKPVLQFELVMRVWKRPIRTGGVWGRFEVGQELPLEVVVALLRTHD